MNEPVRLLSPIIKRFFGEIEHVYVVALLLIISWLALLLLGSITLVLSFIFEVALLGKLAWTFFVFAWVPFATFGNYLLRLSCEDYRSFADPAITEAPTKPKAYETLISSLFVFAPVIVALFFIW